MYAKHAVMEYIPGGAWTGEQTAAIIERMKALDAEHGFGFYPIVRKRSAALIGHAGLGYLERTPEVEIAYVLDDTCWGQGFATEVARALIAHAFTRIGLERVVAVAFPANQRSVSVMQRAGMTLVGKAFHFGTDVVKYEAKLGR